METTLTHPASTRGDGEIANLIAALVAIRDRMYRLASNGAPSLARVHPDQRRSAENLLHYVALRQGDLRELQDQLTIQGLSSLGRCEGHVLSNLEAVLDQLGRKRETWVVNPRATQRSTPEDLAPTGDRSSTGGGSSTGNRSSTESGPVAVNGTRAINEPPSLSFDEGKRLLDRNTVRLFGNPPHSRDTYVMVTLPTAAATDAALVDDLIAAGMDVARINCAHDDEATWSAIVDNVRRASNHAGKSCRILMDLAGPKLRTGPISGPRPVLKWKPKRDGEGRVVSPARIWLYRAGGEHGDVPADARLPVSAGWIDEVKPGDRLGLTDCRGKKRVLKVVGTSEGGFLAECKKTAYVAAGTKVQVKSIVPRKKGKRKQPGETASEAKQGRGKHWRTKAFRKPGFVGELEATQNFLTVYRGDQLVITDNLQEGAPATYGERGQLIRPPQIGCTLPAVFDDVSRGDRILFDDGRIGAVVDEAHPAHLVVTITGARSAGEKLAADKGINLPDSKLSLGALTEKDRRDLDFAVRHADIVGYSFVRRPGDVEELFSRLEQLDARDLGVILKIENRQAFENLPTLLLTAAQWPVFGVMIARGDLAVELGYERLAEVQEEVMWMCEAAHAPAVWATQVLERLAKDGIPTRAEITDAAMGVRTECVMLNKGPFIVQTVRTLGDILSRMKHHQAKKRPRLRRLNLAGEPGTESLVG